MNSNFVMKHSSLAAKRIIDHAPGDFNQQLAYAYQLSLSRNPKIEEIEIAKRFFGEANPDAKRYKQNWEQFCQILISSIDFQNLK